MLVPNKCDWSSIYHIKRYLSRDGSEKRGVGLLLTIARVLVVVMVVVVVVVVMVVVVVVVVVVKHT